MPTQDPVNISISDESYQILQQLKEEGVLSELRDGFRLGMALAIAQGKIAETVFRQKNILNVGSLDPDGVIRNLIAELYPDEAQSPYSVAERLAEAGIADIGRMAQGGNPRFGEAFQDLVAAG